jgi:hypothetical protein
MKYLFLILSLFLVSCGVRDKRTSTNENMLIPNEDIAALLDSFIIETNCDDCVFEIYIDKQLPEVYHLIFYAGYRSLSESISGYSMYENLEKIKVRDIEFHLFTGAEKYFSNLSVKSSTIRNECKNNFQNTWVIIDSCDIQTLYKIKDEPIIPYFPLSANVFGPIVFTPPRQL